MLVKKLDPNAKARLLPGALPVIQSAHPPCPVMPPTTYPGKIAPCEPCRPARIFSSAVTWGCVRQLSESDSLQSREAGLNWHLFGLSMSPSFTPSAASQEASAAA